MEEAGRSQAPGRSREADRESWGQRRDVALQGGRPGEGGHPSGRRARRWPDSDGGPETPVVRADLRGWLLREILAAGATAGAPGRRRGGAGRARPQGTPPPYPLRGDRAAPPRVPPPPPFPRVLAPPRHVVAG